MHFALNWVNEHSRIICGYVYNKYYLNYSAYEEQDFLSEAYLAAYEAAGIDKPFAGCFWNIFKNRCKQLANQPHCSYFTNSTAYIQAVEQEPKADKDLSILLSHINIFSKPQQELINLIINSEKALSIDEIAGILDITRQAADQRVKRIVNLIKSFPQVF